MLTTRPSIDKYSSKNDLRIDYIDLIKGICMIWIIWSHTLHPDFINAYYHVPLFFFVSGFFLSPKENIKTFIRKRLKQLIRPLVFFYIAYYPLWIITYIWDHKTLGGFQWDAIRYIFSISSNEFIDWNGPLWFLLVLFCVNCIVFLICKTKYAKILLTLVVLLTFSVQNLFSDNQVLKYVIYTGYYSLGVLGGKYLIRMISQYHFRIIITAVFLYLCLLYISYTTNITNVIVDSLLYNVMLCCFFVASISLVATLDQNPYVESIRYFGKNSLILLGCHWWLTTAFIQRILNILFNYNVPVWTGIVNTIITLSIISVIIPILNKHCKFFLGKK